MKVMVFYLKFFSEIRDILAPRPNVDINDATADRQTSADLNRN